jgi:glycosyltransferase involved in cell wall biosynthesis
MAKHYDFTKEDLILNAKVVNEPFHGPVRTALWIIPHFLYAFYGGIHTIFRFADYMTRQHGVWNTFVIQGVNEVTSQPDAIAEAFPRLRGSRFYALPVDSHMAGIPYHDIGICTAWQTAYPLMKFNQVRKKLYFMQDYEPLFYPAGTIFGMAEESYRFGFTAICNTISLKKSYEAYGGKAVYFSPSVDRSVFYPDASSRREGPPYRMFFYGRPFGIRNCFELAVEGMKKIKERMGDSIEIVSAGGDWNLAQYGLEGVLTNIGRLSYQETGGLYRSCHAGLSLMMTRHVSYPPIELMACGVPVITNRSEWKNWILRDRDNCYLTEAVASRVAETVQELFADPETRKRVSANAIATVNHIPSWDEEFKRVFQEMMH